MSNNTHSKLVAILGGAFALIVLFTGGGHAQNLDTYPTKALSHPKLESLLMQLKSRFEEGRTAGEKFAEASDLKIKEGDMITVFIIAEPGKTADDIDKDALKALGGRIIKSSENVTKADVPISMLTEIADKVSGIGYIKLPDRPSPLAYQSEGVVLSGAFSYHSDGYTGLGVKVAVIDLGFAGLLPAILNGDLPSNVVTVDCTGVGCVPSTFSYETDPHGTAVAEIVHDMAPGAQLYLIKIADPLDLVDAKNYCIANGIRIVNHSVGYWNQNFYDGQCYNSNPVCTANDAYLHNILWVNAAGNHAQNHYEATFTDPDGDGWHNVSGDVEVIRIDADPGSVIIVHLTWNAWPITDQDYDLYLYDSLWNLVRWSENHQTGTQPPTETIAYSPERSGSYYLAIRKFRASSNHKLEVYSRNHKLEPAVASSSLLSPADAAGAFAVGAINYQNWITGPQADYSSQGPTNDGRIKPEISGPDGVSTFAGNRFSGTSAASPHVAGAAALILSRNPNYSVTELWNALTSSAIDMGPSGQDNVYGHGRLSLPQYFTLSISKTGSGTVTSEPPGVNCGNICSASYPSGTGVVLTARPDSGWSFSGWGGDSDCLDGQVMMNANKTCTATFTRTPSNLYTLTVTKSGTGTGTVTSNPPGISCGADCSEVYSAGATVTLTAVPGAGSAFTGWSGDCSGANPTTTVIMNGNKSCTATFTLSQHTITTSANPPAGGSITCTPNPVGHGLQSICTVQINPGFTLVTVTGTCGGTLNGTTYTTNPITSDCMVEAQFSLNQYRVTATGTGNGAGNVSSAPAGINFDYPAYSSGSANFDHGTTVTLTAAASAGSTVAWTCPGGTTWADGTNLATCTFIDLDGPRTAQATFTLNTYSMIINPQPVHGTITSTPPGITCGTEGSACSADFPQDTQLTLVAMSDRGYVFRGWGGDCSSCGTTPTCFVGMDGDKSCQGSFGAASGVDLTGEWMSLIQSCSQTRSGLKCKLTGNLRVENRGNLKAPSGGYVHFYMSSDPRWDSGDELLKEVPIGSLKPGQGKLRKFSVSLPLGQSASGKYVIGWIDATGVVEEWDETNNMVVSSPIP